MLLGVYSGTIARLTANSDEKRSFVRPHRVVGMSSGFCGMFSIHSENLQRAYDFLALQLVLLPLAAHVDRLCREPERQHSK